MIPAYFNWSGGKDSAFALYKLLQDGQYDIRTLVTTVNAEHERISMHGVRRSLLEQQAKAIGFPVREILLPNAPDMASYEAAMQKGIQPLIDSGIRHAVFGDIFLEDLRRYREEKLAAAGVQAVFPLWGQPTRALAEAFIDLGFKTIVVCVQADKLDASFTGRVIDRQFLDDLPGNVDPCGENGEFHTFVFDGPVFREPVRFRTGERVFRTYARQEDEDNDVCGTSSDRLPAMGFHYIDLSEE